MRTVEEQNGNVPFDIECHTDTEGNIYDYAFGLNWRGVIDDSRTRKYKRGKILHDKLNDEKMRGESPSTETGHLPGYQSASCLQVPCRQELSLVVLC